MRNFDSYYSRMGKNLAEKADFIIDELINGDYDTVVDVGCADGALLSYICGASGITRTRKYIGFDKPDVISKNIETYNKDKNYFNESIATRAVTITKEFVDKLKPEYFLGKTLTIFSSVLHELDDESFSEIMYYAVFSKTVAIRDMFFEVLIPNRQKEIQRQIVTTLYQDNEKEEMEEDYFSIDWKEIDNIFNRMGYIKRLEYTYFNKYLKENVSNLKYLTRTTHRKQLWIRND